MNYHLKHIFRYKSQFSSGYQCIGEFAEIKVLTNLVDYVVKIHIGLRFIFNHRKITIFLWKTRIFPLILPV